MGWTRGTTIGCGSSATVSIATAHGSGNIFAVKSMELSKSETLQRERQILSTLDYPQIVTYKGWNISTENGKPFYNIFMEYAAGGSLFEIIHRTGGGLNEETIKSYTRDILLGLDYLHSNGIVHCDIKGRNILVADKGVRIADLGCAKKVEAHDGSPIVGTPLFMAPEVARGEQQGFAADVWGLGCVVIEMATGGQPWLNMVDPVTTLYRIGFTTDVPDIPSFLSEEGKDFMRKCLKRDPLERWSVAQLLNHEFVKKVKFLGSPTSVLGNNLWEWNLVEDFEIGPSPTRKSEMSSPEERIRKLCAGKVASSWIMDDWASNEDWVTVKENCNRKPNRPSLCLYNEPKDTIPDGTNWSCRWYATWVFSLHKSSINSELKIEIRNSISKDLKSGSLEASKCSNKDVICGRLNWKQGITTFSTGLSSSLCNLIALFITYSPPTTSSFDSGHMRKTFYSLAKSLLYISIGKLSLDADFC